MDSYVLLHVNLTWLQGGDSSRRTCEAERRSTGCHGAAGGGEAQGQDIAGHGDQHQYSGGEADSDQDLGQGDHPGHRVGTGDV